MSTEMVRAGDESREKVIESLVLRGDLSGLTPAQRAAHYHRVCGSLGLNPDSQPFAYLKLNGKEILYAGRGATDQLAAIHRVNREIIDGPRVMDLAGTKVVYCVAKATHPNGRTETSIATLPFVDPVNVLMKAETKAKRRATLSILGLGMLDETEVETIPGAQRVETATIGIEQTASPALDAPSTWAADLAACSTLRDVRACWSSHRTPDTDGATMAADVRAWLNERGLSVAAEGVTALLGTMHDAAVTALGFALCSDSSPSDVIETAIVEAARQLRASSADAHSREVGWKILRRAYGKITSAGSIAAAGEALKAAMDASDEPDPTPPTGTDGTPSREPGEDDGSAPEAFDAARSRGGEARAQVTELRVVRDESSDPCVTSAAAWREHLATHRSPWAVRGAFHKRAAAFAAEGVHTQRESAAIDRIAALGEPDARGLLHSTPRRERRAA